MNSAKCVLVTGGAGFVGRHFCSRLIRDNWEVYCVDNLLSESALPAKSWPDHLNCSANSKFHFFEKDCRDFWQDQNIPHFDLVLHLAAVVGGRAVIENAPIAVAADLAIDADFFQWAVKSKPSKTVYFSSSAAYPIHLQKDDDQQRVLDEDLINFDSNLGMPDMSYGWAKLTGEYLARLAHQNYNLDVVCYRPFSGYGEDQATVYPFPAILRRAIDGEDPVVIWSNTCRDFVYIEDCVDCVLQTMHSIHDGTALNIATGVPTNFSTLVKKACDHLQRDVTIQIESDKPTGVHFRVGNPDKAAAHGFTSSTNLEKGIKICVEYLTQPQQ